MFTDDEIQVVVDLIKELSSELDLHYDDEDFFALRPSIEVLQRGVQLLKVYECDPPPSCIHVINRFNRHHN